MSVALSFKQTGKPPSFSGHRHRFLGVGHGRTQVREFVLPPSSCLDNCNTSILLNFGVVRSARECLLKCGANKTACCLV